MSCGGMYGLSELIDLEYALCRYALEYQECAIAALVVMDRG